MEKIYKNWTLLKLSKMSNKIVKCNALGVKDCKNKFCIFLKNNTSVNKNWLNTGYRKWEIGIL